MQRNRELLVKAGSPDDPSSPDNPDSPNEGVGTHKDETIIDSKQEEDYNNNNNKNNDHSKREESENKSPTAPRVRTWKTSTNLIAIASLMFEFYQLSALAVV